MLAKVRDNYRWHTVTAFAGSEYVDYEWRPVPVWAEGEALRHSLLDVQADEPPKEKKDKKPKPKTQDELKAEAKAAGIPNYWSMNRDTLEARLDEITRTD